MYVYALLTVETPNNRHKEVSSFVFRGGIVLFVVHVDCINTAAGESVLCRDGFFIWKLYWRFRTTCTVHECPVIMYVVHVYPGMPRFSF